MRIKKFTGTTMQEVTEQMRKELGPDAIILNSRKVAGGSMLNFLGREMLEVTAAIDDHAPAHPQTEPRRPHGNFQRMLQQETSASAPVPAQPGDTLDGLRTVAAQFERRAEKIAAHRPNPGKEQAEIHLLRSEMEEMRSMLTLIADHLKYSKMPALPGHLQEAFSTLVQNGVDERIAADLVQSIYGRLDETQLGNRQSAEKVLLAEIARMIRVAPAREKGKKPTVVVLIGPTGVGKTTTIAKLAAIHKLIQRQDVGLISADTFRIGAIEQLRTFAGIADIPMEVVYKPSEIPSALRKFRKKDIIFIDTVGRSQRAKKELSDLKKFIEAADPDETHLVLNSAASIPSMKEAVERFGVLKPNRLVMTKIDEATAFGSILTVLQTSKLPVSYITTGQTVPDDILPADAAKIASMIFHGVHAHA